MWTHCAGCQINIILSDCFLNIYSGDHIYVKFVTEHTAIMFFFVLFQIKFGTSYPDVHPYIECLTNIFHPNIELAENGGGVCVSLLNDWSPSNTIEDVIMSLLFLLYNPNLDDPLSEMPEDMDEEEFKKAQQKILNGDMEELEEDYDLEKDQLSGPREAYNELQQCEWDVLAEAAKVAWAYNLEQEKWQDEMKLFEQEEKERKLKQIENNKAQFESSAPNTSTAPSALQRTDFAFGKSSLQRCSTVTAPVGQANALNFIAPNKDAVLSWCPVPRKVTDSMITEEEDMDCTPAPTESQVPTEEPSGLSWQPFCKTDRFDKPVLQRILTC